MQKLKEKVASQLPQDLIKEIRQLKHENKTLQAQLYVGGGNSKSTGSHDGSTGPSSLDKIVQTEFIVVESENGECFSFFSQHIKI